MERFLSAILGGMVRDLVSRLVNWGFDRAARANPDHPGPDAEDRPKDKGQPMARDLGDKARQLERLLRRLGR